MFCFLDQVMHIFLNVIMDISFCIYHLSYSCVAFCINHYIVIHVRLACLCAANHMPYVVISRMLYSLIHDPNTQLLMPCIFQKKKTKKKSLWSVKVYTTFLVTCVGYHDDSYKQTMLGLYTCFSWKMIENHVNMVPNTLLTRKGWFFRRLKSIS